MSTIFTTKIFPQSCFSLQLFEQLVGLHAY